MPFQEEFHYQKFFNIFTTPFPLWSTFQIDQFFTFVRPLAILTSTLSQYSYEIIQLIILTFQLIVEWILALLHFSWKSDTFGVVGNCQTYQRRCDTFHLHVRQIKASFVHFAFIISYCLLAFLFHSYEPLAPLWASCCCAPYFQGPYMHVSSHCFSLVTLIHCVLLTTDLWSDIWLKFHYLSSLINAD